MKLVSGIMRTIVVRVKLESGENVSASIDKSTISNTKDMNKPSLQLVSRSPDHAFRSFLI